VLRRKRDASFPLGSLDSDSSGGSERGLDVAVNGLAGGLVSSFEVTVVLNREDFPVACIFA